jgi:predicted RNA-binding Zn-ribbon protein involved in translation (DUF1610 family)
MMEKIKEIKAGDPCPSCGGEFVVDEQQDPGRMIDRVRRNAANPAAAERFATATLEKAAEHGLIHRCVSCGYRSRFQPKKSKAA